MPKCKSIKRLIPATCAWVLLLSTTILFFCFPCRQLLNDYHYSFVIVQGVITIFVISNLFATTFVDPGIIKRANEDEDKGDFRAPIYIEIQIEGHTIRMKWCPTCQFYRPPRCSHCSVCDNCIETFDHHCPWVNNCIGRRNYRHFFFFLIFLTIHMITVFAWCLLFVFKNRSNLYDTAVIIAISLMFVIIIFFIPVIGLTGFHIILVARGRTTNEQVTGKFNDQVNPFSNGCLKNCLYTLCGPRYPGLYKPKQGKTKFGRNHSDSNFKIYMDNFSGIELKNRSEEPGYFSYSSQKHDFSEEMNENLQVYRSNDSLSKVATKYKQIQSCSYGLNEKHIVTMHQTENGTKETTFVALSSSKPSKISNEKPGIFQHYNKISASPSKSTSINEISSQSKKFSADLPVGPEGGMLIYYSPDAGCISNTDFISNRELRNFDNFEEHTEKRTSRKPIPFQKALEISNEIENKNKNLTKNDNHNRQSQYEMHYEISV